VVNKLKKEIKKTIKKDIITRKVIDKGIIHSALLRGVFILALKK